MTTQELDRLANIAIEEQGNINTTNNSTDISELSPEDAAVQALANYRSGKSSLGTNKLPPATWLERGMANALATGDEKARVNLLEKGYGASSREPGWFSDEPGIMPKLKELGADIAESVGPAAKFGAQTLGEVGGGIAGLGTGPFGVPAGIALGGSAGRGAVQSAFEGIAEAINMAPGGADKRVIAEYMNGLMGSAIGAGAKNIPGIVSESIETGAKVLGAAGRLAGKIPGVTTAYTGATNFVKGLTPTLKEQILGGLSKIPKDVRDIVYTIPKGWNTMVLLSRNAHNYLANLSQDVIVPSLNKYKSLIGQQWEASVGHILDNPKNTINFDPIKSRVADTIKPFTRKLNIDDVTRIKTVLQGFFSISTKSGAGAKAMKTGRYLPADVTMPLGMAYKKLEMLDDLLQTSWSKVGEASKSQSVMTAMLKGIRKDFKEYIHQKYPEIRFADKAFEKAHDIWETGLQYFGENQKAADFARNALLLKNPTSDQIFARRAFEIINAKVPVKFSPAAKLFSAAEYLTQKVAKEPSGFQYSLLPRIVGGGIGGIAGATVSPDNRWMGAAKGAAIGAGTVYTAQFPFLNPARAASTMARLERLNALNIPGKVSDFLGNLNVRTIENIFKTPLGSSLIDMQSRLGIETTEDDLRVLKARTKAVTP